MKKMVITKELNLLDIEDIEQALSEYLGIDVSIDQVKCSLAHCIPADTHEPSGAYLEFQVDEHWCDSGEVFEDEEEDEGGHYWNGERLALDEPWASEKEIFNFDVSAFKAFDSWTDTSD